MSKAYTGTILMAMSGFLFWILIMPTYDHISALKNALAERDEIYNNRAKIVANIEALSKSYATRSIELERFANIVPAKKSAADLVSAIQALATENGLALTSLSLGSTEAQDDSQPYFIQPVDIGLSGSYLSFRSFLTAVEQNLRLLDVVSIDVSQTSDNTSVLGLRVKTNAYYLKNVQPN